MAQDKQLPDGLYAKIDTDKGEILLELFYKQTPLTVINFAGLAEGKLNLGGSDKATGTPFYDGLKFHRVIKDFMIQGGCPQGTGTGGPGYTIAAEFNDKPHVAGTLSMARTNDPDTAGSQFFICLGTQDFLDGKYTAFGQTADEASLETVNKIGVVPTNQSDLPNTPVTITKATVIES